MVAVRITPDMEMVMVATPDHFLQYGFPQTPAELAVHPCIAYQFCRWQPLSVGAVAGGQTGRHIGPRAGSLRQLHGGGGSKNGVGVGGVPEELVTDELARGTLIRVLQRFSHRLQASIILLPPSQRVARLESPHIDTLEIREEKPGCACIWRRQGNAMMPSTPRRIWIPGTQESDHRGRNG